MRRRLRLRCHRFHRRRLRPLPLLHRRYLVCQRLHPRPPLRDCRHCLRPDPLRMRLHRLLPPRLRHLHWPHFLLRTARLCQRLRRLPQPRPHLRHRRLRIAPNPQRQRMLPRFCRRCRNCPALLLPVTLRHPLRRILRPLQKRNRRRPLLPKNLPRKTKRSITTKYPAVRLHRPNLPAAPVLTSARNGFRTPSIGNHTTGITSSYRPHVTRTNMTVWFS